MGCCVCVKESQIGFIESFGRFDSIAYPGVTCINCCSHSLAGTLSLRVEQYKLNVETRSKDNVFINLHLAVMVKVASDHKELLQYQERIAKYGHEDSSAADVMLETPITQKPEAKKYKDDGILYNAYYRLENPVQQILALMEEYFRFHGMEYTLDDMFAAKNDMTHELQQLLNQKMNPFGFVICNVLVLDIIPDAKVRHA